MRRKVLLGLLGLLLAGFAGLILYLEYADHRGAVEDLVSDALGRRLTIAGKLETEVGWITHVVATDVTLANPAWSDRPAMVHVDRLEGSIDLWSLFRGPVRLGNVRIEGARVLLEADGEGRANWQFDPAGDHDKPEEKHDGSHLDELFQTAEIHDFKLSYRDATPGPTLEITIDRLVMHHRADGMLDVEGSGGVNQVPVELAGRIGTLGHLLVGEQVDHDVHGRYGGAEFSLQGRIGDYATLSDPDVKLGIHGPDLAELLHALGLSSELSGPFRLDGELAPESGDIVLTLEAELGDLSMQVRGTVDTLLHPSKLDLQVAGSGPDLEVLQGLPDIRGLPAGPFEITGGLHHEDGTTAFRQVRAQVGGNDLLLDGVLGDLPGMVGTDLSVEAQGPDLSTFSTMAGIELPAHPFRLSGHVVRNQKGTALKDVEMQLGQAALELTGELGDWPEFTGTNLDFHLTCPDASVFSVLSQRQLPDVPVDIRGRIRPGKKHHFLEDVEGSFGQNTLKLDGTLVTSTGFVGTDVQLHLTGPDLSLLALVLERDNLPDQPFDIAGHFRVLEDGHWLEDVQVRLGAATLQLDGTVVTIDGWIGTELQLHVAGPDLSRIGALADMAAWPVQPFEVHGHLEVVPDGYAVKEVEVSIGTLEAKIGGHLGPLPDATGTELDIEARADDLSALASLLGVESLPAEAVSASGHVRFQAGGYQLQDVTARVGKHELEVKGTLVPAPGLIGTEVTVQLSGPSVADLNRLLSDAGLVEELGLPAEPYTVAGTLRVKDSGYDIQNAKARVGPAHMEANGFLGALPQAYGTDLSLTAEGPDGVLLGAFAGVKLPQAPFSVSGRVQRSESATLFHDVKIRAGDYHAEIDGSLGPLPELIGTRLDVNAAGPGLELFSQFFDIPVTDAPFTLSGHFDGTLEQFALSDFAARLGSSDLNGSFRLDLTEKPTLHGEFTSKRINTLRLSGMERADGSTPEEEEPAHPGKGPQLLIPDDPIELEWLDSFDAEVHWNIEELDLPHQSLKNIRFDLSLHDSRLEIGPLQGEGQYGGSLSGSITIQPDDQAYQLSIELIARDLLLSPPSEERGDRPTPYDVQVDLTGTGNSLHGMASTANGSAILFQGEGSFDNRVFSLLTTDVLAQVFTTLNPFSKKERYTGVVCGAHVTHVEDGMAKLGPLALVTDKMKIVGRGNVDLETEKIDLSWTAKPRHGLGLSASIITNQYVKLSGTLSKPYLTVKPLKAATTTAAAVGTAGLSLLAKGFWDRFTSTKRVCKKAQKKYGIDQARP